jgi:hypothetical protein
MLRQDAPVDDPIDVPERDVRDHGGLNERKHVPSKTHKRPPYHSSDRWEPVELEPEFRWHKLKVIKNSCFSAR